MASADSPSALTEWVSPGKVRILSQRAAGLYLPRFFDSLWASRFLARSPLVAGLSPFVFLQSLVCLRLLSASPLGSCLAVRLRLPLSAPSDSFHSDSLRPCRAHEFRVYAASHGTVKTSIYAALPVGGTTNTIRISIRKDLLRPHLDFVRLKIFRFFDIFFLQFVFSCFTLGNNILQNMIRYGLSRHLAV